MQVFREKKTQRRRSKLPLQSVAYVGDEVFRETGLRVDLDLLDAEQETQLKGLVDTIRRSGKEEGVGRSNPGVLDAKDRQLWETLVARAAGKSSNYFDVQRKAAAAAAAKVERARQPHAHPRLDEPGTITLPPEILGWLQDNEINAAHLLLLTVVIGSLENGAPVHRMMRIEGDTIVVKVPEGLLGPLNPDGDVRGDARALRELGDAGTLVVVRKSGEVHVKLGEHLAAALNRRRGTS